MKRLLLGNEALALGAINAGLSGVYAYPGTPSTDVTEFIQDDPTALERKIHCRWSTNEKTAIEAALGMSYAGKRALVCMKHVGLNVAADPFVNSAITGINGGLVVFVADDPSMLSSQNEQDSRYYAKFAMIPVFEPSTQQETYEMIGEAFDFSEKYKTPVLFRMVTRLSHSRANVEIGEPRAMNPLHPANDQGWVLIPAIARKQYDLLIAKQPQISQAAEESKHNILFDTPSGECEIGVICMGVAYNYVRESINSIEGGTQNIPVLKISQYPLPVKMIQKIAAKCRNLLIVEDSQPFVEEQIKGILWETNCRCQVKGRLSGDLPRSGELTPDSVAAALGNENEKAFKNIQNLVYRPPALCKGCGHRDMYTALNEVLAQYPESRVFGDIGCYTLGMLPPFRAIHTCIDMGASITMAKGAADAGIIPAVAVIGDSTFTHSGMTGLLDAVNENAAITIIISDNLTTAMTGGQQSAGTGRIEQICKGIGLDEEHLKVVIPLPQNMEEIRNIFRQEIEYKGTSVIIARRECIQTFNRRLRSQKQLFF